MTSEPVSRFVISLHAAACERLPDVECITLSTGGSETVCQVAVGLPKSYAGKPRRRYPLVLVFDAATMAGSVIEMSRLMSDTGEIRECIVVAVHTPTGALAGVPGLSALFTEALLAELGRRYRIDESTIIAFAGGDGAAAPLLQAAADRRLRIFGVQEHGITAFVDALRTALSTGREYGRGMPALRHGAWTPLLRLLSPLLRLKMRPPMQIPARDALHRLRSEALDRDFEIFVSLPRGSDRSGVRHPALVVLDASIEFATVAEAARRLADAGLITPIAVIGVGVPRAEGHYGFAFRRFEEFSPPMDGYDCDDDLGRIFRALYATRGEDARQRLGRAADLLRFLSDEMLPALAHLPIDFDALGLLGHSAGGTFVGYALHQPDSPFRDYIAVSPGIAISGDWLLRAAPQAEPARRAASVRLSIGSEEKINAFNLIAGIPLTRAYADLLRARGLRVHYSCYDGETHSSIYPRAVEDALLAIHASADARARRSVS